MSKFTGTVDALPTGIAVETINALMEAGATEKTAYAVAWRDAGCGSNEAGGLSMEAVFGAPVKSGGFGNLVTAGLRKIGRGDEVASNPMGAGTVKVTGFAEYVANYRRTMEAKAKALRDAATKAAEAVATIDADALVQGELDRLKAEAERINAEADALNADPSAFVDAATERLRHVADTAVTAYRTGMELIDAELVEGGLAPLGDVEATTPVEAETPKPKTTNKTAKA